MLVLNAREDCVWINVDYRCVCTWLWLGCGPWQPYSWFGSTPPAPSGCLRWSSMYEFLCAQPANRMQCCPLNPHFSLPPPPLLRCFRTTPAREKERILLGCPTATPIVQEHNCKPDTTWTTEHAKQIQQNSCKIVHSIVHMHMSK